MALRSDTGPLAHVPLWILESSVHHGAIRLYAFLSAKWCDREGLANPSRSELATALNCSTDSIDRWAKQLVSVGALSIQKQKIKADQYIENLYLLKLFNQRGSRTHAARVAASVQLPQNGKLLQDIELEKTAQAASSEEYVLLGTGTSTKKGNKTFPRFEAFWSRYPRKIGKATALKVWNSKKFQVEQNTQLYQVIMDGLTTYLKVWHDEATEDQYICHPVRFLKERRWEDEPTVSHQPKLTKSTITMMGATERFLERHRKEG